MIAYEFPTQISPEGTLELPNHLLERVPKDQAVRVIILISEPTEDENVAWSRLSAEQFLAGYTDADAIYDEMK